MPKFGRRHYQAIADAMKEANRATGLIGDNDAVMKRCVEIQWDACINALVWTFSRDNPRFSETRFKEACNP